MSEQNIRKGQQYCYESISLYGYIKLLKFRENVSLVTIIWLSKNMLFRRKRNARKIAGFILQLYEDWSPSYSCEISKLFRAASIKVFPGCC